MSKKAYVFSTLANDQKYIQWAPGGGDVQREERAIVIWGGSGVANKRLVTPMGVCTEIDEADIAFLESNEVFKLHAKNGFVRIERKNADPEKVAADMNRADPSAQKTAADYANIAENEAALIE